MSSALAQAVEPMGGEIVATDWVQTVEVNSWPSGGRWMTAVIFRDRQGQIIDWRWAGTVGELVKQRDRRGVRLEWCENGVKRVVYGVRYVRTVTPFDQELWERQFTPVSARRRLSPPGLTAL